MSDYLWDKTGEPDAETERIENLLGQLRFQPTPFDLPAELPAKDFRAARSRNVLSWPRLAVAASIALALVTGAWLLLKQQTAATNDKRQLATRNGQANAVENPSTAAAPEAAEAANEKNAGDEKKANETPAFAPSPGGETQREKLGGGRVRPRVPDLDKSRQRRLPRAVAPHANRPESARATRRQKNLETPRVENTQREETAQLTAEREAAEKVLYALRVTSEKLNYARQQVEGRGRGANDR